MVVYSFRCSVLKCGLFILKQKKREMHRTLITPNLEYWHGFDWNGCYLWLGRLKDELFSIFFFIEWKSILSSLQ